MNRITSEQIQRVEIVRLMEDKRILKAIVNYLVTPELQKKSDGTTKMLSEMFDENGWSAIRVKQAIGEKP